MGDEISDLGSEEVRIAGAGSSPEIDLLSPEEQKGYYKKILDNRIDDGKMMAGTAHTALKNAIKQAEDTQTCIVILNVIMFVVGIGLIGFAVYAGFEKWEASYGVLYGGVGFATLVSSFFVGSMRRSQNAVSDLVQVEITFLNYFEQTNLWEQYAATRERNVGINKENIEKAAERIDTCAKDTLELLQKYIEITEK
jgi:hypothetical protein